MPIIQEIEAPQGKTLGDLGIEALWFAFHTLLAVLLLMVVVGLMFAAHASNSESSKIVGIVLAFLVPMVGGFVVTRIQGNQVARYVWVAGLLFFAAACVWVLDLPTGPGLCESCGAADKLFRTFFELDNGSGLLGGDGLLVGTMIPLATVGYAAGAGFGLDAEKSAE